MTTDEESGPARLTSTHAIDLAEACSREHAFSGDDALLLAADDAIRAVHT